MFHAHFRARRPATTISTLTKASSSSLLSTTHPRFASSYAGGWEGRKPDEHVTNRKDELDVQSSASQSGKKERAAAGGSEQSSSATTEKDHGNQNEKAHKDHPEAPGPVLGMNDERGSVGVFFFFFLMRPWRT